MKKMIFAPLGILVVVGLVLAIAPATHGKIRTRKHDIVDLMEEKKIEVKIERSHGIKEVGILMYNYMPHELTVNIPIGAYFVSGSTWVNDMMMIQKTKIRLDPRASVYEYLRAASVSMRNQKPDVNSFIVQRSPH